MSAWIKMMPVEGARGFLKEMFDKVMTPSGTVDNVMRVHSLRPQSMNGHYTLYKSVLHHADLSLPLWFLEAIAVYTSILNRCDYSLMHHYSNFEKLQGDVEWCRALRKALEEETPEA
ncbi:MAG: alkylhydroperoxidase, partial [bacterium]